MIFRLTEALIRQRGSSGLGQWIHYTKNWVMLGVICHGLSIWCRSMICIAFPYKGSTTWQDRIPISLVKAYCTSFINLLPVPLDPKLGTLILCNLWKPSFAKADFSVKKFRTLDFSSSTDYHLSCNFFVDICSFWFDLNCGECCS